ncbi:hypothetical protein A2U01_0070511, partial [Trifolium medium]|nr:hypothetical protein [Trifolium medium]
QFNDADQQINRMSENLN